MPNVLDQSNELVNIFIYTFFKNRIFKEGKASYI